jgi:lysyl-tRNA synthetase class 2
VSQVPEPPVPGWPEESAHRLQKLEALRALGVDPYPARYPRSHSLAQVAAGWGGRSAAELEAEGARVRIAGRVLLKRPMGKASFVTLGDGEARLQIYVRKDEVGERAYRVLELVDLGDFVGAAGRVMRTRMGELSVQLEELTFLSKALLPPPEKWHGLEDVETRYRQRYLDLMANPAVRGTFLKRFAMVAEMRRFMDAQGYLEVETPMMQPVPGGALARPFVTRHNALGMELYLRIAPELYLKRLSVGGLERVYEINRNFRNEGIDAHHNPEFTMLEFYTAYFDCRDVMEVTEALIDAAARRVLGDAPAVFEGREMSFRTPFPRVTMLEAVADAVQALGYEPALSREAAADREALERWIRAEPRPARAAGDLVVEELVPSWNLLGPQPHGRRIAHLFDTIAQPRIWHPTFVVDHPIEISPLSKRRSDARDVADRFELFAAGMEIANGFSELNDALDQRQRFLEQAAARAAGDAEAHVMDEDYVRALGHGMPPTGGCGVGIDRLAMLLTGSGTIRDVILFPHMRPEAGRATDGKEPQSPQRARRKPSE